jgi:hypothetical protein
VEHHMPLLCLVPADIEKMLTKNPGNVLRHFLKRRLSDQSVPVRLFSLYIIGVG